MRRNLARSRDALIVDNLPPGEHITLEYRTRFGTRDVEFRYAVGRLAIMTLLAIPMAYIPVMLPENWDGLLSLGLLVWASTHLFLYARDYFLLVPRQEHLVYAAGYALAGCASMLIYFLGTPDVAYLRIGFLALAVTLFVSHAIAKSYAHWMAVNPLVRWERVQNWKAIWPRPWRIFPQYAAPEGRSPLLMATPLIVSFGLSHYLFGRFANHPLTDERQLASFSSLSVFIALPLGIWLLRRSLTKNRLPLLLTFEVAWRAVQQWITYDRRQTRAPGVFRFPDRWARIPMVRDGALILCILLWAIFIAVTLRERFTLNFKTFTNVDQSFVTGLLLTLLAVLFLPAPIFAFIHWMTFGSLLARYYAALEMPGAYVQDPNDTPWERYMYRLKMSPLIDAHNYLLLGTAVEGDYPVLMHSSILDQHAHLVGDSGSGKTSLGIIPILVQLLQKQDCSVVILDLKGERALFETARLEAEQSHIPFKWFTTVPDHSSYIFNPFLQSHWSSLSPTQRTQLLLQGLSLDFGESYGKSFFTAMNEVVLLTYLRHHEVRSFRELYSKLRDKRAYSQIGRVEDFKNAQHLAALVDRLSTLLPLNVDPDNDPQYAEQAKRAIDVQSILTRQQLAYFYLSSPQEPMTSPAIAKLFFYSLFSAASQMPVENRKRVYVIVDEFQQVISESIRLVLEQGRSLGISFILAHQSAAQLDRRGVDLADTVDSCTAFKQIFRVPDVATMKRLEELSGDAAYETLGWRQASPQSAPWDMDHALHPDSATFREVLVGEQIGPRLERNTIIDVSAEAQASIVRFSHNYGYTQFSGYPIAIVNHYPMTLREFRERESATWPLGNDGTVMVDRESRPAFPIDPTVDPAEIDRRLAEWERASGSETEEEPDNSEETS